MEEIFSRNVLFWGEEFQNFLKTKNVFVFGLGGVGGYALDSLARAGIENFTIIDFDTVSKSNINRQLIAQNSTVGMKKTELFEKKLKDINPNIKIKKIDDFFEEEDIEKVFSQNPDFIIDAIDSLKSKIKLIKYAKTNAIPIITSFGAGNRLDCTKLKLTDIKEIKSNDQFVKNILSKLKKEEITQDIPVVWSEEKAHNEKKIKNIETIKKQNGKIVELTKYTPASTPFVPPVCGYMMANWVILELRKNFLHQI